MPESQIFIQDYVRPEKVRPQSTSRRHAPKIANATPLGLSAFAMSMMVSALFNLGVSDVKQPNIFVSLFIFTGGLVQFTSGMWEFKNGNTFGATGFSAFGGFWFSYGAIYIPSLGIIDAFKDKNGNLGEEFNNAMAIYLLAWLVFTVIFTLACLRTNVGVLSAFVFLSMTIAAEVAYNFSPSSTAFIKFAGVTGLLTSASVFYCLGATLLTPDLSPISLPLWDLSQKS